MGRSLKNSLYNLGTTSVFEKAVAPYGLKLEDLYELEPDAGLGNGGLGRLAACFMDALATGNYPAMGYSLRYEYGLFKQKIVDGWQIELPDVCFPVGKRGLRKERIKILLSDLTDRLKKSGQKMVLKPITSILTRFRLSLMI